MKTAGSPGRWPRIDKKNCSLHAADRGGEALGLKKRNCLFPVTVREKIG